MDPTELFPIALSLRVATVAVVLVAPPGILLALLQARHRYRFRNAVDALILLPLVLPPSVVGYLLIRTFGRHGILGGALESLGVQITFTPWAATMAAALVALPLLVKTVQPAFESVPRPLEDVGRSLGLAPGELFFRVSLPMAWRGVVAGLMLAFARAIGEFGATLMFAGNIPGRTNTMPLEIFSAYQTGDDARAGLYVAGLVIVSLLVVVVAARLTPRSSRQ